uniref:Uncharacterized protein n=1 Tax=Glossina pallidipes TaxID=7398 RepID=A0A1A9ZBK0_GLOPL
MPKCKPIPIQSLTLMQFCIAIIRHLHQTNLFSCSYVTNTLMMALLFIRHHVVANDDNDCHKSNLLRYLLMLPITKFSNYFQINQLSIQIQFCHNSAINKKKQLLNYLPCDLCFHPGFATNLYCSCILAVIMLINAWKVDFSKITEEIICFVMSEIGRQLLTSIAMVIDELLKVV